MKKKYRVKSEKDFQKVYHEGESVANRQLVLYVYPKKNQDYFRVGLSVGKKIGNAVERNRIKRLLRRAVYELRDCIQVNLDIILIARVGIKHMSLEEVKKSMLHVMNLADILIDKPSKDGGKDE